MFYVYILRSLKDSGFYIGFTSAIELRFQQHQNGEVESTAYRRPLQRVYYEAYNDEEKAREREHNLKQFGSAYTGLIKRLGYK